MGPVKRAQRDRSNPEKLASRIARTHRFTGGVDYPALSFFLLLERKRRGQKAPSLYLLPLAVSSACPFAPRALPRAGGTGGHAAPLHAGRKARSAPSAPSLFVQAVSTALSVRPARAAKTG